MSRLAAWVKNFYDYIVTAEKIKRRGSLPKGYLISPNSKKQKRPQTTS